MQNSQPKQKQFLKDLSPEAVLPPDQEETTYELWKRKIGQMESKYIRLAEKAPSSLSRTELILTMNLREWRCFFQLDGHQPPHPRIRAVTRVMPGRNSGVSYRQYSILGTEISHCKETA